MPFLEILSAARREGSRPHERALVETTTILGTGALGTALGILLTRANWPLAGVWSRNHDHALTASLRLGCCAFPQPDEPVSQSSLVLIAVSDQAVHSVSQRIKPALRPGTLVVHTSGALGPEVLDVPEALAMHPLQSVPNPDAGVERLPGSFFSLQGAGVDRGVKLVEAVGGRPLPLKDLDRRVYHAAATLVSTSLVVSLALAQELWPGEEAFQALLPLAQGTLDNLRHNRPQSSLTGPAARQDWETVAAHWEVMPPHGRELYRAVTEAALKLKDVRHEVRW